MKRVISEIFSHDSLHALVYLCVRVILYDTSMLGLITFVNPPIILDPIPMAAVVGLTLAILIIFLVLVIALLVAYKKEKMCFKSKYENF